MLTYTPQDDGIKPLQPYGEMAKVPPLPDPLILREHRIWRHASGQERFYLFYCMEVLPARGFFCVYAQSFKQSHWSLQYDSSFVNQPLFAAMLSSSTDIYPTIDECIAAFDTEKVANL